MYPGIYVFTSVGRRELTNSMSDKKEIHSFSQTKKSLYSECYAVLLNLNYSFIERSGTMFATFTKTYLIIL